MHINSHIYISRHLYLVYVFMQFIMAVWVRNLKNINIIKDLAPSYILEREITSLTENPIKMIQFCSIAFFKNILLKNSIKTYHTKSLNANNTISLKC